MSKPLELLLVPKQAIPDPSRLAETKTQLALFEMLQDRHVPITPTLTQSLWQLRYAPDPAAQPLWGLAFQRVGESLGLPERFGRTSFWARLDDVFVREVVEPLLRHAATNIGKVTINTHGSQGVPGHAKSASNATEKLGEEVGRLLSTVEEMPRGFWSYAGLSLLQAFHQRTSKHNPARTILPLRISPIVAELVYEVEPLLPQDPAWQKRKHSMTVRSVRNRSSFRPREGGITGVVHACGLEDIGSAVTTTFAYPSNLLIPRILEEGYMITNRPPNRQPIRDLLLMVVNESPLSPGPAAVVKAAWVDATARLPMVLSNLGTTKTELGWTDLHNFGSTPVALSTEGLALQGAMARQGFAMATKLKGQARRGVISKSSLVPTAFSALPTVRPGRYEEAELPDNRLRSALWSLVSECLRASEPETIYAFHSERSKEKHAIARSLDDYATILMLHVGANKHSGGTRVVDWEEDRAKLLQRTSLETNTTLHAGQILTPQAMEAGQSFELIADTEPNLQEVPVHETKCTDDAVASIVGMLSSWFIEQVVQAIYAR